MADFLVYSMIEWHYRWQRPQQIPTALAQRGHRVFFISNAVGISQIGKPYSLHRDARTDVNLINLDVADNPPNPYIGQLSAAQSLNLSLSIQQLVEDLELVDPVAIVQHPFWAPVLERLPGEFVIYDCMDYHGGFGDDAPHLEHLEQRMIRRADHVVATSDWIANRIEHRNITKVPNAVDLNHFIHTSPRHRLEAQRPVIGYYGAIAHWFDFEYVQQLAGLMPECDFVLAGEVSSEESAGLESVPNVRFLGEIAYADVPQIASQFDVALIPFKRVELTLATNPVKIFEYAAMGLPVVATSLPELKPLPHDVVQLVDEPSAAAASIRAMLDGRDEDAIEARKSWARQQTWSDRADSFEQILNERPLTSIVVLAYNKLELTQACLDSIDRTTAWPHEVIVVDNASTDETPNFLAEWQSKHARNVAIISRENLGFAGGNNLGIEAAKGQILVLLNNDTETASGWLAPLVRTLLRDERVGMVGPATNNSGNESRIAVNEKDRWASVSRFLATRPPQFLETDSLAFFCVAARREVLHEIGELDTAYGIGMFEDDDYCKRLHREGYATGVNFQSFVHHKMSATFDELGSFKQELFEKNREIFEGKWGPWKPHRHLDPLPNTSNDRRASVHLASDRVTEILFDRLAEMHEVYVLNQLARQSVENERITLIQTFQSQLSESDEQIHLLQLLVQTLQSQHKEAGEQVDRLLEQLNNRQHEVADLGDRLWHAEFQVAALRRSRAFRLGRFLLLPIRLARRLVSWLSK